jgi:hypothetical protein
LGFAVVQRRKALPRIAIGLAASSHRQPTDDAPIDGAWYADAAITPLVHGLGTPKDEDAALSLKHSNHGAPRETGQRSNFGHGVNCFLGYWVRANFRLWR